MTVRILNKDQKEAVRENFKVRKWTVDMIAAKFSVSPRTIERVLIELGELVKPVPLKQEEYTKLRKIMRDFKITSPEDLKQRLSEWFDGQRVLGFDDPEPAKPVEITVDQVQQFLNNTTPQQLAAMFYNSGLVKIAEMHAKRVADMQNTQQEQQQATAPEAVKVVEPKPPYYGVRHAYKNPSN